MYYYAHLDDRGVLAIDGGDARDFLQGLITGDVRKIGSDAPVFAALLSPQGRFLYDFFITVREEKFLLDTDKTRLPDLIKRLTLYRLRSKVHFEELPDMQVAAAWNAARHPEPEAKDITEILRFAQNDACFIYADPRLPELGWRVMDNKVPAFSGMTKSEIRDYDRHRISLGVPEGSKDLIFDRSILLEYGYDELGAVDFDKGCYVGQELTARTKHRAALRKFIYRVHADNPLPARGTPVLAEGREAGILTSVDGNNGLAHMRVDEVKRALEGGRQLTAGNVTVTAALPSWCKTVFETA
jgi:folate-binding protein YgfZ